MLRCSSALRVVFHRIGDAGSLNIYGTFIFLRVRKYVRLNASEYSPYIWGGTTIDHCPYSMVIGISLLMRTTAITKATVLGRGTSRSKKAVVARNSSRTDMSFLSHSSHCTTMKTAWFRIGSTAYTETSTQRVLTRAWVVNFPYELRHHRPLFFHSKDKERKTNVPGTHCPLPTLGVDHSDF